MKNKTAVEWLLDILVTENEVTLKGENYKLFEQAKEMEKQQIIDAHIEGFYSAPFGKSRNREAEKYYNETFKIMDERDYIAMNKELKINSMKSAVELLLDWLGKNHYYIGNDLLEKIDELKEIEVNLAQQYAEFSILCDRCGMNPIKFKDWLKHYNEKTI
jgi:hypothetical protein